MFVFQRVYGRGYGDALIYIDDMLLTSMSKREILNLKNQLSCEFEMKDIWPAKKILGMSIERERSKGSMKIH